MQRCSGNSSRTPRTSRSLSVEAVRELGSRRLPNPRCRRRRKLQFSRMCRYHVAEPTKQRQGCIPNLCESRRLDGPERLFNGNSLHKFPKYILALQFKQAVRRFCSYFRGDPIKLSAQDSINSTFIAASGSSIQYTSLSSAQNDSCLLKVQFY